MLTKMDVFQRALIFFLSYFQEHFVLHTIMRRGWFVLSISALSVYGLACDARWPFSRYGSLSSDDEDDDDDDLSSIMGQN